MTTTNDLEARSIVVSRMFDAPRELVFTAFTDPARIGEWWGQDGFTTTTHEMDVRPGGVWRFTMHGPDGRDYPNLVQYTEVTPPERLLYRHGDDVEGDFMPAFDEAITFEDRGGKTLVTMIGVFADASTRDKIAIEYRAIEGATRTLERLAAYLERRAAP